MKYTNKFDLPKSLENFLNKNPHDSGGARFTVTGLLNPPRVEQLRKENYSNITEDISDKVMSLIGVATHLILSEGAADNEIAEERVFCEVDGVKISGQIDLQTPVDGGWRLTDYKTTSAYSIMSSSEGKLEHQQQLNCYAEMVERAKGVVVKELEVVAFARDWSRASVSRNPNYPKAPIVRIPIPLWDKETRSEYLTERVALHWFWDENYGTAKENIPECQASDMWERRFAVHEFKLNGEPRKNPKSRFETKDKALDYVLENAIKGTIIESDDKRTRCEGNYCGVNQFCKQWKEYNDDRG